MFSGLFLCGVFLRLVFDVVWLVFVVVVGCCLVNLVWSLLDRVAFVVGIIGFSG